MLEIGTKAPDFTLPDQNGEMKSLSDFRGRKVILYFYPKDMTSGCTKQACAFGELYPQFREKGAIVLGVSKDSVASHKKFEEKYGLPFTLLADPEKKVIQALRSYVQEHIPDLNSCKAYRGESRNRRIIMSLNYHGKENISRLILKAKNSL